MEVRTSAPVPYDGNSLTVFTSTSVGAEEAFLIAYDADGVEVQREQIPTDAKEVQWSGIAATGEPLPAGNYSFAVESRATGKTLDVRDALTYARIVEARDQGAEPVFILEGGSAVSSGQIQALRAPV